MDQSNFEDDVHTEHCCKWHGCKYGWGDPIREAKCTVLQGAPQSYPCEYCSMAWEMYLEVQEYDSEWIEYITRWKTDGGQI